MQTKRDHVDILNLLMTTCSLQLCLRLFFNQTRRFHLSSVRPPYWEYSYRAEKVCYTRQDCQMGITEIILQYTYKGSYMNCLLMLTVMKRV